MPICRKRATNSSASVRLLSTRNHIGACASMAASTRVQSSGQSARSSFASQAGAAWRAAGSRRISASSPARSRKNRRSSAFTRPPARAAPAALALFTAASTIA